MGYWLFKQEPDCYSFADLLRDGETTWDGVKNPLALKHLKAAAVGDRVFYYHTGKQKAVVGVMEVVAAADGVLTVRAVSPLPNPVTLAAIKADAAFAEWELVKQARLSVMPVPAKLWQRVLRMSEK